MSFRSSAPASAPPATWRSLDEKRDPSRKHDDAISEGSVAAEGLITLGRSKMLKAPVETAPLAKGDGLSRRNFLVASGTAAAATLVGCARRPAEQILPYTRTPEYALPGIAIHFASVLSHHGEAVGVIVESHESRPTKIEGNAEHPASNPAQLAPTGGTDAQIQAAILGLYDQDRSAHLRNQPEPEDGFDADYTSPSWTDFDTFLSERLEGAGDGAGLRFLLAPITSPTLHRMRHEVLERFPAARFHTWAAVSDGNAREGVRLAFGTAGRPLYDYSRAKIIVSLDSDFLATDPGNVRAARLFAAGRVVRSPSDEMNRLYVVESQLSTTGATADHRLRLPSSDIEGYALALVRALGEAGVPMGPLAGLAGETSAPTEWTQALAADLVANRGRALVVVGPRQPARLHALAAIVNSALNAERAGLVSYNALVDDDEAAPVASLRELVEAMNGDSVTTLVISGSNPVYDAPADLGFRDALGHVECSIVLASHDDETSAAATWHLPMAHELESWGDHRSLDGTLAIQQPLIAPLRGGRNAIELLGAIAGLGNFRAYHQVRQTFANLVGDDAFDRGWRRALHSGVIVGAEPPRLAGTADGAAVAAAFAERAPAGEGWEVVFAGCPRAFDGSVINNPWLLELPEPVTKLTWDNAAAISPASAAELGVSNGNFIRITRGETSVEIPAIIVPGMADHSVSLALGWGRTRAGSFANGFGFDVYPLRTTAAFDFGRGFEVASSGGSHLLAVTQEHHSMEGRPLAIDATLDQYRETPDFAQWREPTPTVAPLWDEVDYHTPREPAQGGPSWGLVPVARPPAEDAPLRHMWGMVIDLTLCTGCSACIVACSAENNVATVGKQQVARGREMHWMRLDRYFVGDDAENPQVAVQPVACQHCEEAPCENVCPVNATAHSPEGLNEMAYNRCIGTRYCMNNCPYKVRRFNYLAYQGHPSQLQRMQFNPNVSVRMRGVMEKCTYCVQRIQAVRIAARNEGNRPIRDGEIVPACQQACPSMALTFGDLNLEGSRVRDLSAADRHYKLLALVGTQPRTTYLGRIRNLNPAMSPEGGV